MTHPMDEIDEMDRVQDEAEKRECQCLPCDPVFDLTDPGRGGIDSPAEPDGFDASSRFREEEAIGAVDEMVAATEKELYDL